jgi:hypothetical protein
MGRIIARVVGTWDWDEALHLRHEKGTAEGGRFMKRGAKRGAPLSDRKTVVTKVAATNDPAVLEQMRLKGRMISPGDPDAMWSPPGGWTATEAEEHPEFPPGKKWGSYAGKHIRVGNRITLEGREWEVTQISMGHIIIDEASGEKAKVESRIIEPLDIPDLLEKAEPGSPKTKVIGNQGAQGVGSEHSTVRVISPYNEPSTHDPTLAKPEKSKFTAAQWAEFGKAEQLHYIDLMARYGEWKNKAPIEAMVKNILAEFDSEIVGMVKSGHISQYGSSSGGTLSLASYSGSPAKLAKREQAMDLQHRLRDVIAWDTYNRLKAPDIALFHGSDHGPSWWRKLIKKPNGRIFSGLSQSWKVTSGKFGSNKVATPTSIRHIVLATNVTNWVNSGYLKEYEMAIIPQQVVDETRTIFFNWHQELSPEASKWLTNITSSAPKPGSLIETLRDHMKNGGDLPITVDPDVTMNPSNLPSPPNEALEAMDEYAEILPPITSSQYAVAALGKDHKLPWSKVDDDGNPIPEQANEAGIKAGDFMLGLKGTLYWIGPDPNDSFGLRYHKIVPDGKGGLKWQNESHNFEGGGGNKYFFLAGNVPPIKPKDAPGFDPKAWQFAAEEPMKVKDMDDGDVFKVDGVAYQKIGKAGDFKTNILDLESNNEGTVNSNFKTTRMLPSGEMTTAKLQPAKGMSLPIEGEKHIVTSVKKDGMVSVKPVKQGGKVFQVPPDDPVLDNLFDPKDWTVADDKEPLSNLKVGDIFHGGLGKTIRPYRVIEKEGSKVHWENLDTGEKGWNLQKKKVSVLNPVDGTPGDADKTVEPPPVPKATGISAGGAKLLSDEQPLSNLEVGDHFVGTNPLNKDAPTSKAVFEVTDKTTPHKPKVKAVMDSSGKILHGDQSTAKQATVSAEKKVYKVENVYDKPPIGSTDPDKPETQAQTEAPKQAATSSGYKMLPSGWEALEEPKEVKDLFDGTLFQASVTGQPPTGSKAVYQMVGEEENPQGQFKVRAVVNAAGTSLGTSGHISLLNGDFTAFVVKPGQEGLPVADFTPAEKEAVKEKAGAIIDKAISDAAGWPGSQSTPTPVALGEMAENFPPYVKAYIPYGDTDTVSAGSLKPGDWIADDTGAKFLVLNTDPGLDFVVVKRNGSTKPGEPLHATKPDGSPRMVYKIPEGKQAPPKGEIVVEAEDLETLDFASVTPFKAIWGSGGKYKHHRIDELPEGMVFKDKDGKKFKVQAAGTEVVISDGVDNFRADPSLRVRAYPGEEMKTPNPPVFAPNMYQKAEAPKDSVIHNDAVHKALALNKNGWSIGTIAELVDGGGEGTLVTFDDDEGDGVWEIVEFTPTSAGQGLAPQVQLMNAQGETKETGPGTVPVSYLHPPENLGGPLESWGEVPMTATPAVLNSLMAETEETLVNLLEKDGIPQEVYYEYKGQTFALIPPPKDMLGITPPKHLAILPSGKTVEIGDPKNLPKNWNKTNHTIFTVPTKVFVNPVEIDTSDDLPFSAEPQPFPKQAAAAAPVQTLSALAQSDEFEVDGTPFAVVAHSQATDTSYIKNTETGLIKGLVSNTPTEQLLWQDWSKPNVDTEQAQDDLIVNEVGTGSDPGHAVLLLAAEKFLDSPSALASVQPADIEPYGSIWGSGGKYKHEKVGLLEPGAKFTGKGSNGEYILVKSIGGGQVLVWKPDAAMFLKMNANDRVREAGQG